MAVSSRQSTSLDTRSSLWGLSPFNVDPDTPLIISYDYRIAKIEEKDASDTLTGNRLTFSYDTSTGRLTQVTDNIGRTVTYDHDSFGNLQTVTGPGTSATYAFGTPAGLHRLIGIDEGQGLYTNLHDTQGRVYQQTHANGIINIEYITPYKTTKVITTVKDSSGTTLNISTRTVEFDTQAQVIKNTDTRNPIPQGKALLLPLTNPKALIKEKKTNAIFGDPIELDLNGLGIRSIEYWESKKRFLIDRWSLRWQRSVCSIPMVWTDTSKSRTR